VIGEIQVRSVSIRNRTSSPNRMPVLLPFNPADLIELDARETINITGALNIAKQIHTNSTSFTARMDGRVLGCAGVFIKWEGTGQAWVMMSSELALHAVWFHRCVRRLLRHVIDANDLRRVEAVVRADSSRNCDWIETLGFIRETPQPMKHYRPEGDYYLYALTGD